MKVVIVGGVAGGATAAARIRRLDENAEIVVFERSGYISYANCGLPYYIGDMITDSEALTLQTPESFWRRFRVEMKVRHEVTAIHRDRKVVSVQELDTGREFEPSPDPLLEELRAIVAPLEVREGEQDFSCLKALYSRRDVFGVDLYAAGLGGRIEGMAAELFAGPGAVRRTLHKYVSAR